MLINRKDSRFHLPFESNNNDSLRGNTVTVNGTSVYSDSISGKAFDFNGSTQIDTSTSNFPNGSFSILLRGSFDAFTSDERLISYQVSGSGNPSWLIRYVSTSNVIRFSLRNQANTAYHTCDISSASLSTGTVYAIHAYFDAGTEAGLKIYEQNGNLVTSTSSTTDTRFTGTTDNVVIGSDSDTTTPSQYLNGTIDDCLIITDKVVTDEDFYRFYMGLGMEDNIYKSTKYMTFDGVDEYIDCGNDSSLNFDYLDAFSISFWIRNLTNNGSNKSVIGKWDGTTNNRGYFVNFQSNEQLRFVFANNSSGGTNSLVVGTSSSGYGYSGDWEHYIITYDGSSNASGVTMYKDGSSISLASPIQDTLSATTQTTQNFLIGARDLDNYLPADLDDVSVWNKELSAAEVTEIYKSGVGDNLTCVSCANNLVSWWKAGDDGSISSIPDYISGNDGTPTNMESGDILDR